MDYDKIYLILGCGLNENGDISKLLKNRCDLVLSKANQNDLIITSSSFSLNKLPFFLKKNNSFRILSEASQSYNYLKINNEKLNILCEQQSHDTIGSIFFLMHNYLRLFNAKKIFFVTSNFHATRVDLISSHINSLMNYKFNIDILVTDDTVSHKRIAHESSQAALYGKYFLPINSLNDYFFYLITNHSNYNSLFSSSKFFTIDDGY